MLLIYGFRTVRIENDEKERNIQFFLTFLNSQSADYYVFSTITMMTVNTEKVWYTKTTGLNYYTNKNMASTMSKFCPHHIKLHKTITKITDYDVQEGSQKKDYECGTISQVELIIGCGTRM